MMDNGTVQRGFRIPRRLDEEFSKILAEERKMKPQTNRSDVIIMLLNLGIDAYYKNRSGRE